ncbi:tyrosine-type recombinase/integrase [Vibrio tubiashii]|uniref:tyrosine-type recombinase/integrase n=1 Tax=Vibrio tubiashii TaxID=29498 RepID=UPI001EFD8E23|nr:tyrosine-type recombinase/integrase [Vibrio tubiashii]MCG9575363.1 tyrosine-type recombinase/integrase [Vibrio tubiashii]
MSGLSTITDLDFHNLDPKEFAEALKQVAKSEPNVYSHPVVTQAIDTFQTEFFRRRGQLKSSTLVRLKNAWNVFVRWCIENDTESLPATYQTVESYLNAHKETLHRNTLKVHVWAISKRHEVSGLPDPCQHRYVKATMSAIVNEKVEARERIEQAPAFREEDLDTLTEQWGNSSSKNKKRDLFIISLCYETMLRKSNIERMLVGDISFKRDGSAVITIPFTKTNHSGKDEVRVLSESVASMVKEYFATDGYCTDPDAFVLQRLKASGKKKPANSQEGLTAFTQVSGMFVTRVFDRAWKALGEKGDKAFTGHSARVGATQDLIEDGFTIAQIMQAGGWSREEMVLRYGRDILASKGAMALKRSKRR